MFALNLVFGVFLPFCVFINSLWRTVVGNSHLRHVSLPWHWLVPGVWAAGERLPYGPTRGLPREGLWAHEGLWVAKASIRMSLKAPFWLEVRLWSHGFVFTEQAGDGTHQNALRLLKHTKPLKPCFKNPASQMVSTHVFFPLNMQRFEHNKTQHTPLSV